jgi:hypothetical protein
VAADGASVTASVRNAHGLVFIITHHGAQTELPLAGQPNLPVSQELPTSAAGQLNPRPLHEAYIRNLQLAISF